jgi:hypothetical protein
VSLKSASHKKIRGGAISSNYTGKSSRFRFLVHKILSGNAYVKKRRYRYGITNSSGFSEIRRRSTLLIGRNNFYNPSILIKFKNPCTVYVAYLIRHEVQFSNTHF